MWTGPPDAAKGRARAMSRRTAGRTPDSPRRPCHAATGAIALALVLTFHDTRRAAAERQVAAGSEHVCVIQDGGVAACYGNDTLTAGKLTPPAGVAFHAVTAGDDYSCGLSMNGSLLCWGALPGPPPPASAFFIDAHAGPRHVCGLQPNGTVRCYGDGSRGATAVPPGAAFQGVTAGANYTCGVARNHTVACWGDSINPVVSNSAFVPAIRDAEHVACGADHACYIRVDGGVRCWGADDVGQATPPAGLARVWWLAAGDGMTCAVSGTSPPGAAACWGRMTGTGTLNTAFQVACAAWGCIASSAGSGSPTAGVSAVLLPAAGGSPAPSVSGAPTTRVGVVTTLAGRGSQGCDDGAGTAATFRFPRGIAVGTDGSLYIADTNNNVIRRVVPWTTVVSTVAGVCGVAGRNVSANPLWSTFYYPFGVDVDRAGNVYVADTSNHAIRVLPGAWVAGNTSGSIGAADGVGASASFTAPRVVRVDATAGALYVTDYDNSNIRVINATTRNVTTLTSITAPYTVALNASGRFMYVGLYASIKKVTYAGGVSAVAGGSSTGFADGAGTAAAFKDVTGLALDATTGILYAADYGNHRVRKVTPGGVVTTVAGDGKPGLVDGMGTSARLNFPYSMAMDDIGTLYVADASNHAIRQVSVRQTLTTVWAAAAPLPPSPTAADDQLAAWRTLAASASGASVATNPRVDARSVAFSAPLAAVNTAGLNSAVLSLLLGNVTLAARGTNAAVAAATAGNATFSTSAQRGLAALSLTTAAIPANSLALPALLSLALSAPAGSLTLLPGSFAGLPALSCVNCRGATGLANLSGLCGNLATLSAAGLFGIFGITTLDASSNGITAVNENDFNGAVFLRALSLARNNISYVSDAAFSYTRHPVLAIVDQSGNPLVAAGGGCRAAYYPGSRALCLSEYTVCTTCIGGAYCTGRERPSPCPAGSYCPVGVAAGTPCLAGSYCPQGAVAPTPCPPGFYCPAGSAAANLPCPAGSYCPLGSAAPPPVLGLAPATTGAQTASAAVLLPPLSAPPAGALVNITVAGTALCAGASPRLTSMVVGGVPCAAVACPGSGSSSLATCVGWNASAAVAGIAGVLAAASDMQVTLNATAVWASVSPPQSLRCDACVPAFIRPSLASIVPATIAAAGVPVVLTGAGFMDASRTPPTVLVGGVTCGGVAVLLQDAVQCTAPAVLTSAPGFPVVSVVVVNAAGAASTEGVTLTYPASFSASWVRDSLSGPVIALPGAPLAPSPVLVVLSREAATCALTINAAACTATATATTLLARPVGMTVQASTRTPLTVAASGSVDASTTALVLDGLALNGASGCAGTLVASCIDANGAAATTAGQSGPTLALAGWRASWNHTLAFAPLVLAPEPLPALTATFQLGDSGNGSVATAAAAAYLNFTTAASSSLSCVAVLLPAAPAPDTSLERLPPRDVLSSAAGTLLPTNATAVGVAFTGLTAAAAALGEAVVVHAECTWTPTGERARLPPVPATVASLQLGWEAPPSVVQGYKPQRLRVGMSLAATVSGAAAGSALDVPCNARLLNATVRSATVAADVWTLRLDPAAPPGTAVAADVSVSLQAPPGTVAFLVAECVVWGLTLAAQPLRLSTALLTLRTRSPLPSSFVASDTTAPAVLEPPLVVAVTAVERNESVTDISCAVTTATPATELRVLDPAGTASLQTIPADPASGDVAVPRFVVQTNPTTPHVSLIIACRHTVSGDAPPPLAFDVPAVQLRAAMCVPPVHESAAGAALLPFSVGIGTASNGGGGTAAPCDARAPNSTALALPPIACTISLKTNTSNDTSNIFLRRTVAAVAAGTREALFDAFTVVAPQGETYGLTVTCSVGGLAIPPTLAFYVSLQGCPPGQESVLVACVTCGGSTFSLGGMGARCTGCPPVGAGCNAGILTLQPRYFRPASHAGQPLGPDTELHACYNSEACTLAVNGSGAAVYGCAAGYTGPLCGVCDAGANYARFGEACAVCWDPAASWSFLVVVITVVSALLTRVALRTDSSRSDASIVLRITLSYLQAVGSLRVFRAGSTQAYGAVMGWTEVVSASPLSVGALQCIMWLPYLVQYVATVTLPLLAAAAVAAIFLSVSAARACRCRPRCSLDAPALRAAVRTWLASKRHLSTLLFVLFLAYMPIISASLRALDCIPPVAGVAYLRSDLAVECGVGQHAAARVLAYTVLVVAGLGFPAGLAWLLGTASTDQLLDDGFHATWGFLFDGYRSPSRTLVASADATGSNHVPVAGAEAAAAASRLPTRRRSSVVPERLAQAWVVAGDSRVWWEAVVLARKAGVVLLAVTVTNPYMQCVGATLWFAGFGLLQLRYTPYTKPLFNALEMGSLAATFLTAVVSTALLQFNVGVSSADTHAPAGMTAIEWAVTVALVTINLGTFAALTGLWLRLQCRRAHGAIMRRMPLVAAMGTRMAAMRAPRQRSSATAPPSGVVPVPAAAAAPVSALPSSSDDALAAVVNPLRVRAAFAASPAAGAGTLGVGRIVADHSRSLPLRQLLPRAPALP